jgi:hypothetical protein
VPFQCSRRGAVPPPAVMVWPTAHASVALSADTPDRTTSAPVGPWVGTADQAVPFQEKICVPPPFEVPEKVPADRPPRRQARRPRLRGHPLPPPRTRPRPRPGSQHPGRLTTHLHHRRAEEPASPALPRARLRSHFRVRSVSGTDVSRADVCAGRTGALSVSYRHLPSISWRLARTWQAHSELPRHASPVVSCRASVIYTDLGYRSPD